MTTTKHFHLLAALLQEEGAAIRAEWEAALDVAMLSSRKVNRNLRQARCEDFLSALTKAMGAEAAANLEDPCWSEMYGVLDGISTSSAKEGNTPGDTASFVFSVKQPLFSRLQARLADEAETLTAVFWTLSTTIDRLGLYTVEVFQRSREQIVTRQQQELLELSTPVISLWEGILALPLIGTLDSMRAQVVMENVLQKIVDTGASIAIIDITGVPTVDTLVAQHLIKTIAAARLMGADCIISGIRPQIAQTIVHLGIDLANITTKASLADAFLVALERTGAQGVQLRQS